MITLNSCIASTGRLVNCCGREADGVRGVAAVEDEVLIAPVRQPPKTLDSFPRRPAVDHDHARRQYSDDAGRLGSGKPGGSRSGRPVSSGTAVSAVTVVSLRFWMWSDVGGERLAHFERDGRRIAGSNPRPISTR